MVSKDSRRNDHLGSLVVYIEMFVARRQDVSREGLSRQIGRILEFLFLFRLATNRDSVCFLNFSRSLELLILTT